MKEVAEVVKEAAKVAEVAEKGSSDEVFEDDQSGSEEKTIEEKEIVEEKESVVEKITLEERLRLEERIRLLQEALRLHKLEKEKEKTPKCRNCGEVFTADHQCSVVEKETALEVVKVLEIESPEVESVEVYLCYNCDGEGHFARECPYERPKYFCFNCGGERHFARDCDK